MLAEGLGRDSWRSVIESLEEFMPYYERVNYASTLLQLPLWRSLAAGAVRDGEEVLEIGPGPGGFASLLRSCRVYLLEPSVSILKFSASRLREERYRPLVGLAEDIPLKEASLDRVFCIFSFRDFLNKERALREIHRVLRTGGRLHIVDLFRPSGKLQRRLMEFWLRRGAAALLRLLVPGRKRRVWKHDPYRELLVTYDAIGSATQYEGIMREIGFTRVETKGLLLGSVCHIQGAKPSTM
ncbi:MAG: methyltransferase domain-containing protein [Thermoplasmata archaeon]